MIYFETLVPWSMTRENLLVSLTATYCSDAGYHCCCLFVDHIEANVEVASARVESGNKQLGSAVTAKVFTTSVYHQSQQDLIIIKSAASADKNHLKVLQKILI